MLAAVKSNGYQTCTVIFLLTDTSVSEQIDPHVHSKILEGQCLLCSRSTCFIANKIVIFFLNHHAVLMFNQWFGFHFYNSSGLITGAGTMLRWIQRPHLSSVPTMITIPC